MKNGKTISLHNKLRPFPEPIDNESTLYPDKTVIMKSLERLFH